MAQPPLPGSLEGVLFSSGFRRPEARHDILIFCLKFAQLSTHQHFEPWRQNRAPCFVHHDSSVSECVGPACWPGDDHGVAQ